MSGAGTLHLSNASYSGLTLLSVGRLNLSGSIGVFTVANGGTFSPGNSPGLLTVNGDLSLSGVAGMELANIGTRGIAYDATDVNGAIAFGGTPRSRSSMVSARSPARASTSSTGPAPPPAPSPSWISRRSGAASPGTQAASTRTVFSGVCAFPIPEPSTYAALGGLAIFCFAAISPRRSH